jgi:hypothetical protein
MGGIAAAMADASSWAMPMTVTISVKYRGSSRTPRGLIWSKAAGYRTVAAKSFPGAMPWLHRWWGNPMFSWLARTWFNSRVHDVYCGLRGFSKQWYETLNQRCTVWSSSEMIKSG